MIKFLCLFVSNIKVYGKENIPPKAPFIVSSNHREWLDIPLITIITWIFHSTYIAKKEYWQENGWLTFWLNCVEAIPVDRKKPSRKTIKRALQTLNNKEMLIIFPEGTRNKTEQKLLKLKPGIRLFAYRYEDDLPILPIALAYSKEKNIFSFPKKVIIYIEEPFMKSDTNKKDFMSKLEQKITLAYKNANLLLETQSR